MHKNGILIVHLIAVMSVGNNTKHTYTVQKNKANVRVVNSVISIIT